jgi:HD superfamily phosphohydrolase
MLVSKRKMINDPVHGMIELHGDLVAQLMDHAYFQRLRGIQQLGLSALVYPGAVQTRFLHAIGATHLMNKALETLKKKGVNISTAEHEACLVAMLLHDIGHAPFSHALEHSLIEGVGHEEVSLLLMEKLNEEFQGKLSLALQIFQHKYPRKFLSQLVSSQLDMDRLDYLKRDSFYAGVSEGEVGVDRIIDMLHVKDDILCVEEKGIYSIEKFLLARKLMYWQVYLHKTVIAAEQMLVKVFIRAKQLAQTGENLFASDFLKIFLYEKLSLQDFKKNPLVLDAFTMLDDAQLIASMRVWTRHKDFILSDLCKRLLHRRLFKVEVSTEIFDVNYKNSIKAQLQHKLNLDEQDLHYYFLEERYTTDIYKKTQGIHVLSKTGELKELYAVRKELGLSISYAPVTKYFICYPKDV